MTSDEVYWPGLKHIEDYPKNIWLKLNNLKTKPPNIKCTWICHPLGMRFKK